MTSLGLCGLMSQIPKMTLGLTSSFLYMTLPVPTSDKMEGGGLNSHTLKVSSLSLLTMPKIYAVIHLTLWYCRCHICHLLDVWAWTKVWENIRCMCYMVSWKINLNVQFCKTDLLFWNDPERNHHLHPSDVMSSNPKTYVRSIKMLFMCSQGTHIWLIKVLDFCIYEMLFIAVDSISVGYIGLKRMKCQYILVIYEL